MAQTALIAPPIHGDRLYNQQVSKGLTMSRAHPAVDLSSSRANA